jgi:site-specific recombinase XerD
LPEVFEDYLHYRRKVHQTPERTITASRRVLVVFAQYLERHRIKAAKSDIEQIDAFLKDFSKWDFQYRILPGLSVLFARIFALPVR